MSTIHKVDIAGQAGGWFDETSTASGWFYRELEDTASAPADDTPGNACMSLDVCVEGYAQTSEYYGTDEIQGEQRAPLEDFVAPPEESILCTSIPDYLVDEMFEPGEFWFQTGPPTSLDDETGETRGQTSVPDYLDLDDELDPSDVDWQLSTTLRDAVEDTAGRSVPDDMALEDEPLQDGWQQCVTMEDIPPDAEITLTSVPSDLEPEADVDSDGWQHGASDDGVVCYFPAIVSVTPGSDLSTGTTHVVSLPTVNIGDLAVVVLATNGNTHTATAGWTEVLDNESVVVYSRVIDGTEGGQMTVTSSASTESVWYVYQIAAGSFDPVTPIAAATSLNSATQDPPNLAFGWTDKTLVLAAIAGDTASSPITFTSGPSNLTTGFVGQETGGIALPDCYLAVAWGFVDGSSLDPNTFSFTAQSSNYDIATIAIRGYCPVVSDEPAGHEFPADLEPEAEVDSNGWFGEPLHDAPAVEDISGTSVPTDFTPEEDEAGYLDTGWQSEPLHDTPSSDDITDTSVPVELLPEDQVDADGWAFRLPDMDAAPVVEVRDPGVSVGTLPGVRPRRKWWVENISAEEKKRKKIHGTRWPDLPDVDVPKKFNPRVVTDKMVRPRLDAAHRDWKNRIRKARQRDDEIIMAIIAVLLAEGKDDT